jgi:hypothetical protein
VSLVLVSALELVTTNEFETYSYHIYVHLDPVDLPQFRLLVPMLLESGHNLVEGW